MNRRQKRAHDMILRAQSLANEAMEELQDVERETQNVAGQWSLERACRYLSNAAQNLEDSNLSEK